MTWYKSCPAVEAGSWGSIPKRFVRRAAHWRRRSPAKFWLATTDRYPPLRLLEGSLPAFEQSGVGRSCGRTAAATGQNLCAAVLAETMSAAGRAQTQAAAFRYVRCRPASEIQTDPRPQRPAALRGSSVVAFVLADPYRPRVNRDRRRVAPSVALNCSARARGRRVPCSFSYPRRFGSRPTP
jgi:hypothetical protein